ncbi:hypothetical protein BZG36_05352 [Bifiguratus adelaidae]|uniref:Glycoside hydrolase family 3 N-terminal domain-containing protein n=1 Tax=Bifiguratus adelaidae TaxID=1938954 RepID=A0A261XTK2_9FUNG|nr:hypothetical protein BZG36_05352 [Bifiguratus adelaidae]
MARAVGSYAGHSGEDLTVQAAYHVIYSYTGVTAPSELLTLVREGKVGGIILYGENVSANLSSVMEEFQSTYKQSPSYNGLPLLITTDQEGGEVRRVAGGPYLSEKQVGESSDPAAAATLAGQQAYQALYNKSINANLAPVVDVYRQPGDFTDEFQRSYGNTSTLVSECAPAFVKAQQAQRIIATAKHFPGLGAATAAQNTDEVPVTLNLTLNELRTIDMVPYKYVIAAGVKMVMPSWALYPALDPKMPSGLSPLWIQGELRGRLGYKGVTISDAIEAGALEAFGDDGNRAVLASQAGMDIILAASQNYTQGSLVVDALVKALKNGSLPMKQFNEATKRILDLRAWLKK